MSDLVKRVRAALAGDAEAAEEIGDIDDAAELLCDEIENLRAELENRHRGVVVVPRQREEVGGRDGQN